MIGALGFGHVAIRAKDFDTMHAFYTEKLGFPEFLRFHDAEGKLRLVFLRVTDTEYIELFPDGTGEPLPKGNMGVFHICITVDDLQPMLADLASRGVAYNDPAKSTRTDGNLASGVTDPEGNYIEIIQNLPTGAQTQAITRFHAEHR